MQWCKPRGLVRCSEENDLPYSMQPCRLQRWTQEILRYSNARDCPQESSHSNVKNIAVRNSVLARISVEVFQEDLTHAVQCIPLTGWSDQNEPSCATQACNDGIQAMPQTSKEQALGEEPAKPQHTSSHSFAHRQNPHSLSDAPNGSERMNDSTGRITSDADRSSSSAFSTQSCQQLNKVWIFPYPKR